MSTLVVIGFKDEASAFEMRAALAKLQSQYLIEMEDAVVVTCDPKGKLRLHQAQNLAAAGAVGGAFWGTLIGMLFLAPVAGGAIGAGYGALMGKFADVGINDAFMKELSSTVTPGTSALFLLVRRSAPDKVLAGLAPFAGKGRVIQTSLTKDKEEELRSFIEGQRATVQAPETVEVAGPA